VLYLPEKFGGVVFRDAASPATGSSPPSGARIDFRIEHEYDPSVGSPAGDPLAASCRMRYLAA